MHHSYVLAYQVLVEWMMCILARECIAIARVVCAHMCICNECRCAYLSEQASVHEKCMNGKACEDIRRPDVMYVMLMKQIFTSDTT